MLHNSYYATLHLSTDADAAGTAGTPRTIETDEAVRLFLGPPPSATVYERQQAERQIRYDPSPVPRIKRRVTQNSDKI